MLDPDIQALVELGDHTAAVGLYQQRHGGSVLTARNAVEAARQALTRARGAAPESPAATVINDPELDKALRAGLKIDAVKRYRELYGVGLKEAVDAVEAIQAGTRTAPPVPVAGPPPAAPAGAPGELQPELDRLIAADQKIMAIKHYREVTGVGLKEAKDAVEARMDQLPRTPAAAAGLQPELDRLLTLGHLIPAIKHYRTVFPGAGLKEAKDAVEAHDAKRRAAHAVAVESGRPALQPELDRLIAADQKIMAIKHYRECTHAGLKEAKDAVEARMAELAG